MSWLGLAVAVAASAAACGNDSGGGNEGDSAGPTTMGTVAPPGAEPEDEPQLPVTVTGADGVETTVTDVSRIIPVNGDIAEVVFALGLGDSVVATDLSATYPPEADALPEIGYQRALLTEQVSDHDPTVVIGNTDAGPPEVLDQLRDLGVSVVILDYPHDLTGPADKIRQVAVALGVPARGEALARQVDDTIADAADRAEDRAAALGGSPPRAVFLYLRGDSVQMVGGQGSGVDALLEATGAIDIGVEMGFDDFEPLGAEALFEAEPEVLVVTTTGLQSAGGVDQLVKNTAIVETPAGRDRRVIALDDQLLLGLGPRTGEALDLLVDELYPSDRDRDDNDR